ncbi:hypothetical protein DYB30_006342 [Aphanomyces astaci]|uniref:Uncharacterized protein n=1 Tax=Aphanomyces astaci TaxID=112090 RepID=A0A397CD94_APHAT|nr:hypothetical protein DYB30_006342 [Aphanomyces astaci]RHY65870.1 hypothetical protein DYB38_006351 [Aphanomyces astaci]
MRGGFTGLVAYMMIGSVVVVMATCPVVSPKKSNCWCDDKMKTTKVVGMCDGTRAQHFHQSAHNAKNNGARHYLCCDKARVKSYCMTISQAQACGWEQGIAFY